MKKYNIILICLISFIVISCEEDFLDTEAARSITAEQVAATPAATEAIVNGIYANLRNTGVGNPARVDVDYGQKAMMAYADMLGHDVVLNNFNWYIFVYNYNGRQQTSSRTNIVWNTYYTAIADANSVILSLDSQENRTEKQNHFLGQSLAIKSFSLFNLVRFYCQTYIGNENGPGVPVPDRIDLEGKPRGTLQEVYDKIIPDLEKALELLDGFERDSKQQMDKSVVHGILANVYLETGDWAKAASNASQARSNYSLMPGEQYASDGFDDISNVEWMWGADIDSETSTTFISFFSHFDSTAGGYGGAFGGYKKMVQRLYEQIPNSDLRKKAWVNPENPPLNPDGEPLYPDYTNLKFIDATGAFEGDYSYMRAAEMYLIQAEALARLGDPSAADILFELVSNRNPDYTKSTNTGNDLVEEIYLQRRIELWGEGVNWFDLKRLKKPLDRTGHPSFGSDISIDIGGNFFTLQIPEGELNSNPNINAIDQND